MSGTQEEKRPDFAPDVAALHRWSGNPDMQYVEFPDRNAPQPRNTASVDGGGSEGEDSNPAAERTSQTQDTMQAERLPSRRASDLFPSWMTMTGPSTSPEAETLSASGTEDGVVETEPRVNASRLPSGDRTAQAAPAWFGAARFLSQSRADEASNEALHTVRERVAARWFALRGVLGNASRDGDHQAKPDSGLAPPCLALFSIAGGVGKTSVAASLTRALASAGERVLLVDATRQAILPFYFGGDDTKGDALRVFTPPAGRSDQPVHLYKTPERLHGTSGGDPASALQADLSPAARTFHRLVLDLSGSGESLTSDLLSATQVLVPVQPDMHSVLSLRLVRERLSAAMGVRLAESRTHYLLSCFDESLPLHLDVRELLQQELGEKLLPFSLCRSPVVAEALAQGMTPLDYAPQDDFSRDIQRLASWVQSSAEPVVGKLEQARWSER